MANNTVYPFGPGGQLPSSIGIINDPYTGGADKAWSAEQGKKLNASINSLRELSISSLTEYNAFIATSTGTWTSNASNWKGKFLGVAPEAKIVVKGNAERLSYIAVLKDSSHTNGETPNYATGASLVRVPIDGYYQLTIPSDGAYLYIATLSNNNNCAPQLIALEESLFSEISGRIDIINSQRVSAAYTRVYVKWIINSANHWDSSGSAEDYECELIQITPGDKYFINGNKSGGIYALLSSRTMTSGATPDFCSGYAGRRRINANDVYSFIAPDDAAYVYVCTKSSGNLFDLYVAQSKSIDEQFQELDSNGTGANEVERDSIFNIARGLANKLYPLNPVLDENGFVIPETLQELNVQRKAQQYANVKWTPLASIPYNTNNSDSAHRTFPAGTTVTGIPYSSVKERDKFVGREVSLHTFMTAVKNPYSLLYTECVSSSRPKSAWGFTYHGSNCATYYGQVCSMFSSMCSGGALDYATDTYEWLNKEFHAIVKLYDQSAQSVRVGDTFWKSGHCRLVYAVKKDSNGVVTHVQIAESTYNNSIINNPITATAFNQEIANGCIVYRPLWLYRNIDYVPSPYVAVDGEEQQTVTYNSDICTFAGDKACFREGELVVLNYNLTETPEHTWTAIEVYKDGSLLNTYQLSSIDQSSLDESQQNHALSLGTALAYGKYKARMTDGTNYSEYTEWEVLQTDVSYVNNGGITTITKESANGTAIAVKVCGISGVANCMRELYDEEKAASSFDIDLISLNASQRPNSPIVGSSVYLKIYFQGEFGLVTNEPLPISF